MSEKIEIFKKKLLYRFTEGQKRWIFTSSFVKKFINDFNIDEL